MQFQTETDGLEQTQHRVLLRAQCGQLPLRRQPPHEAAQTHSHSQPRLRLQAAQQDEGTVPYVMK